MEPISNMLGNAHLHGQAVSITANSGLVRRRLPDHSRPYLEDEHGRTDLHRTARAGGATGCTVPATGPSTRSRPNPPTSSPSLRTPTGTFGTPLAHASQDAGCIVNVTSLLLSIFVRTVTHWLSVESVPEDPQPAAYVAPKKRDCGLINEFNIDGTAKLIKQLV